MAASPNSAPPTTATPVPVSPAAATSAAATPPFVNMSLYVGDLDHNVNENQLYEIFNQIAPVLSIRICRDIERQSSLGYAYVNFSTAQDAANAMEALNFTTINGKPIRIMYSHRDPSIRKSGFANVFIKNLDSSIDNKALHDTFAAFGTVLSCKVAIDSAGHSRGYGFVQFDKQEAAENAIKQLNGMLMNDKQVYVGFFVRSAERERSPHFTNVYVKNLPETFSDEDLKQLFEPHGTITSSVVMKDSNGKSRCFGFVNFESPESAATAVEKLNGSLVSDDKELYVGRAQKKSEREAELKAKFEKERISRYEKLQGANLYVKNLDENINDEKLKEMFSEFGTITSCKVMPDSQGNSKGYGFVAFSTPEEASKALTDMNGIMVGRKPLYVAVAQKKEERRALHPVRLAQIHDSAPNRMTHLNSPAGFPGYHPGPPRPGHSQLYYGPQATLGGMMPPPPAAGFGFQQQQLPVFPGMRPNNGPPNFIMPFQHQSRPVQSGQRMGSARRGGNFPHMQHNHIMHGNSNNNGYRYMANNRNGMDQSFVPQGVMNPIMPLPYDGSRATPTPVVKMLPSVDLATLSSALASATPENQRVILGEHLYPLVDRIAPDHTAKVTGMLLEMDKSEVIHLIESPEDLKIKVSEAMEVLRKAASGTEVGEQLSS